MVVLLSIFFSSQRNTDHITRSQESHGTIYSPFKDVPIPDMTFTEYVFSKLDQYKNLTCLVSVLNKAHWSRQNQVLLCWSGESRVLLCKDNKGVNLGEHLGRDIYCLLSKKLAH